MALVTKMKYENDKLYLFILQKCIRTTGYIARHPTCCLLSYHQVLYYKTTWQGYWSIWHYILDDLNHCGQNYSMWRTTRFNTRSFLMNINDLLNACSKCLHISFADDTNFFVIGYILPSIIAMFSEQFAELSVWLQVNKQNFYSKKHIGGEIDIKINNQGIS